jgi:hypothetical protein
MRSLLFLIAFPLVCHAEPKAFFEKHCVRCHGPEKEKGDFRVDTLLPHDFKDAAAVEKWKEVVNVLNGHDMPPKKEPQPTKEEVASVVDWATQQLVAADMAKREGAVVLRRLNRVEYKNTVRDLTGVEPDVTAFPVDPAGGGFDNNGHALTISPMHLELYVDVATKTLDRALRSGAAPETVKWRFEPEEGDGDLHRVRLDKKNNPISHGGKNEKKGPLTLLHHESWDRHVNIRDFVVPAAGMYKVRLRAGSRVPSRAEVVAGAKTLLEERIAQTKQPKDAEYQQKQLPKNLAHFETEGMYAYGPGRLKFTRELAGQPEVIAEFDVAGTPEALEEREFLVYFSTAKAGIDFAYCYNLPHVLENFFMQSKDGFARPEVHLDWVEIEGPVEPTWPPASRQVLLGKDLDMANELVAAKSVLTRFLRRAFRRPVAEAELADKLALFEAARKTEPDFEAAIRVPLTSILASPNFLYLTEPAAQSRPLTDHELAARLSYFFWSTMPDETLMTLASYVSLRTCWLR